MLKVPKVAIPVIVAVLLPGSAWADDVPPVVQHVLDCRRLADSAARLSCYDAQVDVLSAAQSRGDVVAVDREQVRQTRRRLFGFALPSLAIFGHHDDDHGRDQDDLRELNGTVAAATRGSEGEWIVTLQDGARWQQSDGTILGRAPRPGMAVLVRRASMGSFMMQVGGGGVFFRARRVG